jgi:16S rRNA processing protein RimM
MKNNPKNLLEIGKIVKTNGIKGICAAIFYIENENSLDQYSKFYDKNGCVLKFSIYSKTTNNKNSDLATKSFRFLIQIENVFNPEDALRFIDQSIYVDIENWKSSEFKDDEKEFYIKDLIGMNLCFAGDESLKTIGQIFAVHDFGAGPILEIKPLLEFKKFFGAKLMFSFDDEIFPEIKLEEKKILFRMPEFC